MGRSVSSEEDEEVEGIDTVKECNLGSYRICLTCGSSLESTGSEFGDLIKIENETEDEEDERKVKTRSQSKIYVGTVAELLGGNVDVITKTSARNTVMESFCQICKNQVQLLCELKEKLEEVKRDLENGVKSFKEMCEKAEEQFVERTEYKEGNVYWEVRHKILKLEATFRIQETGIYYNPFLNAYAMLQFNQKLNCYSLSGSSPYPTRKKLRPRAVKLKVPAQTDIDEQLLEDDTIKEEVEHVDESSNNESDFNDPDVYPLNESPSSDNSDYEPSPQVKPITNHNSRKRPKTSKPPPKKTPKKKSKQRRKQFEEDTDDEDVGASLKGRMFTDPATGHVKFLDISFKPLENGRYHCLNCDKGIAYHRGSIKKHAIVMHSDIFVCEECGQHCCSNKDLNSHIRRVHRGQDRKFVNCLVCGKPCSSKAGRMEKHMVTHMSLQEKEEAVARGEKIPQWSKHRRHICEICGTSYEMKAYLVQHKIREHPSENYTEDDRMACKEMCPDCGKLVHKHYLKKHQEFVHSEGTLKRYSCGLCEKRFTKASDLRKHKNVVHDKLKPFNCTLCPKQFALKEQLRYHMDNHQNVRPHQCDDCPMSFARKHHLERHIKIFHRPGSNPKRKTYVRGPETKVKGSSSQSSTPQKILEKETGVQSSLDCSENKNQTTGDISWTNQ